eukprot:624758_1
MLNRTFMLHGVFDWSSIVDHCAHTQAMECYFLPLSNCQTFDVLNSTDNIYTGNGPTNCIFGNNPSNDPYQNITQHCTHKVIHINSKNRNRPVMKRTIEEWLAVTFHMGFHEYSAILTSFVLRPQPIVREIVFTKIRKSIFKSLNGGRLNRHKTLSLPIRASDKCKNIEALTGQHYVHESEIYCFTPLEYVYLMNALQYLTRNEMDSVILTSEDASFVQKVIRIMRNETYSNVAHWNVVVNTEDYSVGEGTTTYRKTQKKFGNDTVNVDVGTSFYTDHLISAVSSLVLQVHLDTPYFVVLRSSSWTRLMWNWVSALNCNINHPEKHEIKSSQCIGLHVPGYRHPNVSTSFVLWPRDICRRFKRLRVTRESFYEKFGIHIGAPDQNHFCDTICHDN